MCDTSLKIDEMLYGSAFNFDKMLHMRIHLVLNRKLHAF